MNLLSSIRAKLIIAFSSYGLMTFMLIGSMYWYNLKSEEINKVTTALTRINLNIKDADKLEKDFFHRETLNSGFYETGKSRFILLQKKRLKEINNDLTFLFTHPSLNSVSLMLGIDSIKLMLDKYDYTFDNMVNLIHRKGFKDYGLEGQMRIFIHHIEKSPFPIDQEIILTIRRREKDFLLRKEQEYVHLVLETWEDLKDNIEEVVDHEESKADLLDALNNYKAAFVEITAIEKEIGTHIDVGLKQELAHYTFTIEVLCDELNVSILEEASHWQKKIQQFVLVIFVISILMNIALAIFVNEKLGKRISLLSFSIHSAVRKKFAGNTEIIKIKGDDEISLLSKEVGFMLNKVKERTKEVLDQKELIEKKNHNIRSSINYAQRIQKAMLPAPEKIQQALPESFLYFMPRDIVSGDFYYFAEVNALQAERRFNLSKSGDAPLEIGEKKKLILSAVDCTGHGIPGAFMSMLGLEMLNKIVTSNNNTNPSNILDCLHAEVKRALKQDNKMNKDGMDLSLAVIDDEKVCFAGAKNPLVYIQNGELHQIKGDRLPIGGGIDIERAYTTHTVHVTSPTVFYLFSDGYQDQFGGPDNKKFMVKKMKQLLLDIHTLPMAEQKEILETKMKDWIGEGSQTDDILVIGFKLEGKNG